MHTAQDKIFLFCRASTSVALLGRNRRRHGPVHWWEVASVLSLGNILFFSQKHVKGDIAKGEYHGLKARSEAPFTSWLQKLNGWAFAATRNNLITPDGLKVIPTPNLCLNKAWSASDLYIIYSPLCDFSDGAWRWNRTLRPLFRLLALRCSSDERILFLPWNTWKATLEKTGILVENMLAMRLSRVNNQNLTGWTMRHVFNLEKKKVWRACYK